MQGRIVKGVGGFYYVDTGTELLECKARGLFRHNDITPLPGDWAEVTLGEDGRGYITQVTRKNRLLRPPVSNVDRLFVVVALASPSPVPLFVDKVVSIAESKGIEPVLCFNKLDLVEESGLPAIYRESGFKTLCVSAKTGEGIEELKALIHGQICVFCGNSGVGKSSLLNRLDSRLGLETGSVAEKTSRGRHTTRHVELFPCAGGYIADTPGFADISIERFEKVTKEELPDTFREFRPHMGGCRFKDCSHTKERDCAVRAAVEAGAIPRSRYESYLTMYDEVKDIKAWEK